MNKKTKLSIGLVLILVLSLLVAGCGGDKDKPAGEKTAAERLDGRIIGIEPGAGIMSKSEEVIEAYGLGEKYISAIGPSGPNHEPYFGPLCAITEWESFKQFAPRHQILLAFAVAGPGGQNIWDAERLLEDIDEQTLEEYAPLVKMISIYGNFHSYQYDEVYKGADELLAMEITAPFYLPYIYDLAYEYEMFYFAGYRAEQAMIDRAVQLYDKAYALAAAESPYLQGYILKEKGRSLYYAKRYRDAIDTLLLGLSLKDEPVFYMFLSLSYYALGDLESGAAWEAKVRALFAENERILGEFEQLLHEVKVDN